MLALAFWIACAAVAIGAVLATIYIRGPQAKPAPWGVALVHGALGAGSLAVLLLALGGGVPRTGMGTAGFGPTAAVLFALALVLGLVLAIIGLWRRRRAPGALVGAHAGLAIAGFVVLLALFALEPGAAPAVGAHRHAALMR